MLPRGGLNSPSHDLMEKCENCKSWDEKYNADVYCVSCPDHDIFLKMNVANSPTAYVKDTVFISNQYGWESKARCEEIKKRVMVRENNSSGGDYCVGRMGENGKVQEKSVDIRP